MKSRPLVAILAIALVAETCALVYLLNTRTPTPPASPTTTTSAVTTNTSPATNNTRIATLEAENAKLKKALANIQTARAPRGGGIDTKNIPARITDALASPAGDPAQTKWQRLAALQGDTGFDARVFVTERPFDQTSLNLSPAFLALFEVTPAEQAILEKTLAAAREQVNELTLKNATTRTLPDGSVEIKVPAFPEAGGAAYDQLHDAFRTTLGEDRYTAMQATSDRELDMMFGNFGAENRTVTVSKNETGGVEIKDVGEREGMRRMMMNMTPDTEQARQRLGNLATFLPPNF